MEGVGGSVVPSACRRGFAGAVVLGVAAVHLFRVGAHLSGTPHRLYYSYASDLLLPLGMYFVLCLRSSAGIAVFVSDLEDKTHWIEVGRAFQRFALQSTVIGVRTAHLNQPVEVASLRAEFAKAIGVTHGRPDLVIRFGRGPEMPRSLRRPVNAVLV